MISPYPLPGGTSASGVGWYTQSLVRSMAAAGARVTVIAPQERGAPAFERDGDVTVRRCFARGPVGLARASRAALATGASLTHLQHETFLYGGPSSIPALLPGMARLRAGAGPVVTMHQVVAPSSVDRRFTDLHRVRIPAPAARAGLALVQGAVSGLARTTIVHESSFREVIADAVVLPLGMNETRSAARDADLRAEWDVADDDFVVMCFGFVAPYKGLETVLEATELAGSGFVAVVAGREHPRLAGQGYLDGLAACFGPGGRFGRGARFTGFVDDADVANCFRTADLVVVAYPQAFASSGVLAQALGYGTPVLVSPSVARLHGAPPEMVVPLDPAGMAARFRDLAADRSRLERLLAVSQPLAGGRSWPELAARHLALYEEVLHAQSRTGRRARY